MTLALAFTRWTTPAPDLFRGLPPCVNQEVPGHARDAVRS